MQEAALGDPPPALDEFLMHDGDLSGRTAEADEAQLQPEDECLPKREGDRTCKVWFMGVSRRAA